MIRLLTQTEAALRLGVSTSSLKRWREDRIIPYLPGRPVMFDEKDVDAFAAARAEIKRREVAINEPGTPEYLEKSLQEARRRATLAQLHRRFKAKWASEK